jgi:triosephosphate isomerase
LRHLQLSGDVEVAVFPSCLHAGQVVAGLEGSVIAVGAQDCAV